MVVLYREGWGDTPWTQVEAAAIRDRAREKGFEFVTFLRLDRSDLPGWLPKGRLWGDMERLGVEGTVSVIEERVRRFGGAVREETAPELAARLAREAREAEEREAFLHSMEGPRAAAEEVEIVAAELSPLTDAVSASSGTHHRFWRRSTSGLAIFGVGSPVRVVSVQHVTRSSRNFRGAELIATVWKEHDPFQDWARVSPAVAIASETFRFDLASDGERGWREGSHS